MSILDRLQRIVRAEWNARSGQRGPQGTSLSELRSTVQDARQSLAQVRSEERRLHADYQSALDDAQRYEDIAVEALRRNDESSALESLRRKQPIDDRVRALRNALDRQQRELADLKSALHALRMRIDASRERDAAAAPSAAASAPAPPPPRYYGAPSSTQSPATQASAAPAADPGASTSPTLAPPASTPALGGSRTTPHTSAPSWPQRPPPAAPAPAIRGPIGGAASGFAIDDSFARLDELGAQVADLEASVEASRLLDPSAEDAALDRRFRDLRTQRALDDAKRSAASEDAPPNDDPLRRLRERMEDD